MKSLSRKLVLLTVAFAIIVSLLITGIELWRDRNAEWHEMEELFAQIEAGSVPSASELLWQFNQDGLHLLVKGIASYPHVTWVSIRSPDAPLVEIGQRRAGTVSREYALRRSINTPRQATTVDAPLGFLTVEIDWTSIERQLLDNSLAKLFSNVLLIALVAGFVLLLLERQVMQHLRRIAAHVDNLTSHNLDEHLVMHRAASAHGDELQRLTGGIARDTDLVAAIRDMVGFIAPVVAYPGEFEMEAMASGAMRVLTGEEKPKAYAGVPVWSGFARK